jgi:formylglycine-generating enzyme required for sulfatase activity/subtilisin family serine protease
VDGACVPDGEAPVCGPGTTLVDGACVPDGEAPVCGPGTTLVDGACVPDGEAPVCGPGTTLVDGECVPDGEAPVCGPGTTLVDGACVPVDACAGMACGPGGACVVSADGPRCLCDPGFALVEGVCAAVADPCAGVACGAGACVAAGGVARCLCDAGFQAAGLRCEAVPPALLPAFVAADVSAAEPHPESGVDYVPNELTVYVVADHDPAAFATLIATLGAAPVAWDPEPAAYTVRFDPGTTFDAFAAARALLDADPQVDFTVETVVARAAVIRSPNDLGWGAVGLVDWDDPAIDGRNWYLKMVGAPEAWAVSVGDGLSPVRVGVIDHGAAQNADLALAPARTATCGARTGPENHGTDVAGIAAARGDNAGGLTGVVWNADLYYCETDGTDTCFFYCMRWMARSGVRVMNYSSALSFRRPAASCPLSYPWECPYVAGAPRNGAGHQERVWSWSRRLGTAEMLENDWVLVQSAGNEALADAAYAATALAVKAPDNAEASDALKDRLVVVGALGRNAQIAAYSNRGALTVAAPGGDGEDAGTRMATLSGQAYGTSFAAPLVAGAAALLFSIKPDLAPLEVVEALTLGRVVGSWPTLDVAAAVAHVEQLCIDDGGSVAHHPGAGICEIGGPCHRDCAGKACGDDGCGGVCGVCQAGLVCNANFDCVVPRCQRQCTGRACGDDGCGGSCGDCGPGLRCSGAGTCEGIPEVAEGYVRIEAGQFVRGSPPDEQGRDAWENQHIVTLTRAFALKATEVTQAEWVRLMVINPSRFGACGPTCPVENVNWYEGAAYLNALSESEGRESCYTLQDCRGTPGAGDFNCRGSTHVGLDCGGYRYPTEAEWEYAARAGTGTASYNGPVGHVGCGFDASLDPIAWYCGNANNTPHPVATKLPNAWGLYDMLGNVWEWNQDWYDAYPVGRVDDPEGPANGNIRVGRGGAWNYGATYARAAKRDTYIFDYRIDKLGLRPARSLP